MTFVIFWGRIENILNYTKLIIMLRLFTQNVIVSRAAMNVLDMLYCCNLETLFIAHVSTTCYEIWLRLRQMCQDTGVNKVTRCCLEL